MQTVNWHTMKEDWAFKNLANHVIKKSKDRSHKMDAKSGDIEVLLSPLQMDSRDDLSKCILHLDSNRWMNK